VGVLFIHGPPLQDLRRCPHRLVRARLLLQGLSSELVLVVIRGEASLQEVGDDRLARRFYITRLACLSFFDLEEFGDVDFIIQVKLLSHLEDLLRAGSNELSPALVFYLALVLYLLKRSQRRGTRHLDSACCLERFLVVRQGGVARRDSLMMLLLFLMTIARPGGSRRHGALLTLERWARGWIHYGSLFVFMAPAIPLAELFRLRDALLSSFLPLSNLLRLERLLLDVL